MRRLLDWLDLRLGVRDAAAAWRAPIAGGPSLAHTLVSALALLLVVQVVSGTLMALYYSPSTESAWASVAYLEDQVPLGSFVRGVHRWGMSAIVVVAGAHLVLTAIRGGYRRPREVTWWIGLALLAVMFAYSITGFVLRWDQYGYWATKVELSYGADAPGGAELVQAVQGGNDLGNLTLTRFYALHVIVLPIVTLALVWAYRKQARRHGPLPARGTPAPRWPEQSLQNLAVAALVLIATVAWSIHAGGAGLEGPADPTAVYDARPQWYLRPMYAFVNLAGEARTLVAVGLPLVVFGALAALPLVDARADRPRVRWAVLGVLGAALLVTAIVTKRSFDEDRPGRDEAYDQRRAAIAREAARARRLAKQNGVPSPGGLAVYTTARFHEARRLWAAECAGCHEGDDRKAPLLGRGHASRAHIRSLLVAPDAPEHFGRSPKIQASEGKMPPVQATAEELDALVETIYAETGAADVDAAKAARGAELFATAELESGTCANCHERSGAGISSGPDLKGYGTRAYLIGMIGDPGAPHRFGALDDMPRYADELTPAQLGALADYLLWLRTATDADRAALDAE